jgi:hypothetical protein
MCPDYSLTPSLHQACSQDVGFSGILSFRNGDTVRFNHLGEKECPHEHYVEGKLEAQNVKYRFSELSEILFVESSTTYGYDRVLKGELIVISRSGQRFVLTEAYVWCWVNLNKNNVLSASNGKIYYTYIDPVTRSLRETDIFIKNTVSSIKVGIDVGSMKYNPSTKEYFPHCFVFDPFTGEKLVWKDQPSK